MALARSLLVVLAIVVKLAAARTLADEQAFSSEARRPDFCGERECPDYKLVKETDNYEIRSYESEKWAITNVTDSYFTVAYAKGIARLVKYFKGENDTGRKLNFTTPTMSALKLTDDRKGTKKDYIFGYYIPKDLWDNVPKPSGADVEIVQYPATTRYVKVFGGRATEGSIVDQIVALQDQLTKDNETFDCKMSLAAVYDPPQKLFNRHNEIHIFSGPEAIDTA